MSKLTKTETALLIRAKGNEYGLVHTQSWINTGRARPRSEGDREPNAARKLVTLGLLEHVKSESSIAYGYKGNSTHVWEQTWRITDAGRE